MHPAGCTRAYALEADRHAVAATRSRRNGRERRLGIRWGRSVIGAVFPSPAHEVPGVDTDEDGHQAKKENESAKHGE